MELLVLTYVIYPLATLAVGYIGGYRKGRTKTQRADTMLTAYKARTAAMLKIAGKS